MNRRDFLHAGSALLGASAVASSGFGATLAGTASGARGRELQELLDEVARELGIVGAQLAVFDGETVYELATGHANLERRLEVTPDTLFQIGSTTKVFNAAVCLALVDRGELDLDEPVTTWIPNLEKGTGRPKMTLRQLLSMSAGLDNGPYSDHGRGDDALERYVESLASVPRIFEPGTAFGYSNAGSNVAGLAAQKATGKPWEALLDELVLAPLGLRQSATFPEDLLFHPVALGYLPGADGEPARVPRWGLPRSMAPAGASLCCSAGDLVRFAQLFLRGGTSPKGERVLSEKATETLLTPQIELPARLMAQKWCPGPYWKEWGGEVIHGHSGTNTGGSSLLLWCRERGVAAATISNVPNQGYPLADLVFDTVFPEVFDIEKPKMPKPDTVAAVEVPLERYVGRFVSLGNEMSFSVRDGELQVELSAGGATLASGLVSLGDDRFLPRDPALGGNRGWDLAFWGRDEAGRATHFLNGVFALRRAD